MSEYTLTSFGAVANARELRDAAIAASSNTLTSPSAPFVAGDVGKPIVIGGAGASGAKLKTTIASFVSATEVTLADSAATSVTGAGAAYGTDCGPALDAALDALGTARGGTLIIDGLFFLATPVDKAFGGETAGIWTRVIGTGSDSAIWIGTAATVDAINLHSGAIEFRNFSLIGVPGATRDARRVINLTELSASFVEVGFYGLTGQEAVIYATSCSLDTRGCLFGGCFVGAGTGGYVNSVVDNKNWYAFRDDDSRFIDYGYFRGQYYSKSGFSSTLAWVRADTPNGADGARGESVFRLRGTQLDEGALHGIVAKPTSGSIAHVQLLGLRQNVTPADSGRGVHCQNVQWVLMEQCWQGWASTNALVGHFQDCGTVMIDSLKLSDSVNRLSATNVTALTLKDTNGITGFTFSNVNFIPVTSRYADVSLVKEGTVADSDFPAAPAMGTLAFDRTNNRLYIKRMAAGGWIYFDMDGGDPFGPELVVNGTFDSGTTGWTPFNSAQLSVVSGALRITNAAAHGRAYQAVPTVIGQQYQVSAGIGGGNGAPLVRVGTTQGANNYAQFTGTGGTATFVATTTTTYVTLMLSSDIVGRYNDFDNVTMRAL